MRINFLLRSLLLASVAAHAFWMLSPYILPPPKELDLLVGIQGQGSFSFVQDQNLYFFIAGLKLLGVLGLWGLGRRFGGMLFLASVTLGVLLIPFSGVSAATPIDGFVGAILGILDGAILALIFVCFWGATDPS